ncbi:DUF1697 domain-containing protein [Chryseobacterium sp. MDT2-18]|uniref:DUF1697 domain-containing protein n=1 Tax=Chryseobacterium sp. MDT2-18 TaxID=1259136 RepID=UPI0027893163|nr:DUF1697 domain-containing protein [Chryseobacterium sp. MDT2-18]MDQ0475782.1 uncharacterized protein (DUF1697 family) [Chryseobacterium sp. MDT2-18]
MRYCAFLRGVNVNGTSMKMAEVCKIFSEVGMKEVSSVLATGNILFSSAINRSELKIILEKALSDYFHYEAFLFLKTEKEVDEIFVQNPFAKSDDSHIYIFIGIEGVEDLLLQEFNDSIKSENEKGAIVDQTFYWQISKGYTLDSNFGKILGKKSMKEKMTSRNLNTIEKIVKKFQYN